jgi:hypothetical protein
MSNVVRVAVGDAGELARAADLGSVAYGVAETTHMEKYWEPPP